MTREEPLAGLSFCPDCRRDLAQARFKSWGTPGLTEFRNFESLSTILGLIQAAAISGDAATTANEVHNALRQFPREDVLYRQLMWAYMWRDKVGERLFEEVRLPGWTPITGDHVHAT